MKELIDAGFAEIDTGGGCRALLRRRDGNTDLATDNAGCGLPDPDDWLLVTYEGDWLANRDARPLDIMDHESSPVTLPEAVLIGTISKPEDEFLIWSEEHGAWWNPCSAGYTSSMAKAGRYSFKDAQGIADSANAHGRFCEVPVRLTPAMAGMFKMPSGGR